MLPDGLSRFLMGEVFSHRFFLTEDQGEWTMQKRILFAVGMCFALGCGTESNSGTSTAAMGGSPDKPVVKVGFLRTDHDAPVFVAKEMGLYDNYGVNVELHEYAGGGPMSKDVAMGNIDIGISGVPPTIMMQNQGENGKYAPYLGLKMVASVHINGSGLYVKKGLGVTKFTDLKGKVVAIPGANSIQEFLLKQLCVDNGMLYNADPVTGQPADIQHPVVAAGAQAAAMAAGTIDAAISWEPFITQATLGPNAVADVLLRSEQIRPGHPCDVVVTNNDMLTNYPHSVKQFLKAHKKAVEFINSNFNGAVAVVSDPTWINDGVTVEAASLPNMQFSYYPDAAFLAGIDSWAADLFSTFKVVNKLYTSADLFDLSLEPPQTP
jgi:NitT/TauT family transport system substrate-binding protein